MDYRHADNPVPFSTASRPGAVTRVKRSRYQVIRTYDVACKDCNEDIGRAATGELVTTREEADELVQAHEEEFHPGD